jgi:hypothetical protein
VRHTSVTASACATLNAQLHALNTQLHGARDDSTPLDIVNTNYREGACYELNATHSFSPTHAPRPPIRTRHARTWPSPSNTRSLRASPLYHKELALPPIELVVYITLTLLHHHVDFQTRSGIHETSATTSLLSIHTQPTVIMNNPNAGNSGAGGQDYLDKAFGMGAKKFGGSRGQMIAGNRATSEKIVSIFPPSLEWGVERTASLELGGLC